MKIAGVILAAGQGTRMVSSIPKVLHPLLGKPMIYYSLQTVLQVSGNRPYTIVGFEADKIRQALGNATEYIYQDTQLGTGHALLMTEPILRDHFDLILVTSADMPLITKETMEDILQVHILNKCMVTILTVQSKDARGFGRVVRDRDGKVRAIVEEAQASDEQMRIEELNTSVYCFDASWLWTALKQIQLSPKGEYYLTDLVSIAAEQGMKIETVPVMDPEEATGINTRVHLAEAQNILKGRINRKWMSSGVTIMDPGTTYIEPGVEIGMDSVIWPNSYFQGNSKIGANCQMGPQAIINNSSIGDHCRVVMSVVEGASVGDEVDIGPFAHLRKGAVLEGGVHIGNFGEIKNATLGEGTKMGHFSYIGDATIGQGVNIGAGTITCNYDGEKKNHTEIEDDVFIGSDTMLVAPVKIGKGARTGAGSVVTHDVPAGSLAVGMPARTIRKIIKRD